MLEDWIKWEPAQELSEKYFLYSIIESINGFEIILSDYYDDNKKIKILFGNSVHAYRNTNESYRLQTFNFLSEKKIDNWTFFKVINSSYIQWMLEESCDIYKNINFVHFSFFTIESVVDVIGFEDPKIEFINE